MPDPDDALLKAADKLTAAAEKLADLRPNADLEAFMAAASAPLPPGDDRRLRDNPALDELFAPAKADPTPPSPEAGRAATPLPPPSDPTLTAVLAQLAAALERGRGGDDVVPLWHHVVDLEKAPPPSDPTPDEPTKPKPWDPSKAVNAIRKVPQAAADPMGALEGLGDSLSKGFGPAGVIVWETGKALAKLGEVAIEAGRAQQQHNFQLAQSSAAMAGVQARSEAADLLRDREVGDRTAGSAEGLSQALTGFDDELVEIKVLIADVKNGVLTQLVRTVTDGLAPVAEAAEWFNEWRKTEQGQKMFGKVREVEGNGFGDFAQQAQAEDRAAADRARRAFDKMGQGGR